MLFVYVIDYFLRARVKELFAVFLHDLVEVSVRDFVRKIDNIFRDLGELVDKVPSVYPKRQSVTGLGAFNGVFKPLGNIPRLRSGQEVYSRQIL